MTMFSSMASANVLITECVEGSSNNKALEVSNLGSTTVDLAAGGYQLELYTNGSRSVSQTQTLDAVLPPNASVVVYNPSSVDSVQFASPTGVSSNVTSYNGDDAIVLRNSNGVVDVFGQVGVRRVWNFNGETTQDHTWRRITSAATVDSDPYDSFGNNFSEWRVYSRNTFNGLSCVGTSACNGSQPMALPAGSDPSGDDSSAGSSGGATSSDNICTNCPSISTIPNQEAYSGSSYYSNANAANQSNLSAFRTAIQADISAEHRRLTYSQVWTALTFTDEDAGNSNNVELLYSGRSIAKSSNGSGSAANNPDNWNREHVWPSSHGFPSSSQLAYTDIHHLRAADISMNSSRGNRDFDNGGQPVDESPENLRNGSTSWEPRDEVKGDVARMMFYLDVRYASGSDDNMPDLVLVDRVGTATSDAGDAQGELGRLCTLLEWHQTDIVSDRERTRNNVIYTYQGNRNPFIDNPEWADTLYGEACGETSSSSDDSSDDDNSGGSSSWWWWW